jgi:hypothetical protein
MFTAGAGQSTLEVRGKFVFFQTLIDCLQRMNSSEQDTNELISSLKKNYEGNSPILDCLRNFHSTYSPDKAIWWYTAEPFCYDTINTALRKQDIHMMFLWRSFLSDMHHQLCKFQSKDKIQVYRGQKISKNELETLKNGIGQLFSVNSFFSTSYDRQLASFFVECQEISNDMASVLFEIEADPLMVDTKPFADIMRQSKYTDEHEILFMFGSIFRVSSVDHEAGSKWIIRMSLCDDDDQDVQGVLKYMQKQNGKGQTNLLTLGKLIWKMGYYDLAEKYYLRFRSDLRPDDPLLLSVYEDIAAIKSQKQDYNSSVEWQQQAMQLQSPDTESKLTLEVCLK